MPTGEWPDDERGATSPLVLDGERVGYWVRTKRGTRPLAAHAAWRTGPEIAVEVLLTATERRSRSRAAAPCSRRRPQAARTAGAPPGVKRLRGEHVAVAAGLLLAAVAAVTLLDARGRRAAACDDARRPAAAATTTAAARAEPAQSRGRP